MNGIAKFIWNFIRYILTTILALSGAILFVSGLLDGLEGVRKICISAYIFLFAVGPWASEIKKSKRKLALLIMFFAAQSLSFFVWVLMGYVNYPMECTSINPKANAGCRLLNSLNFFGGKWLVSASLLIMALGLTRLAYLVYVGKLPNKHSQQDGAKGAPPLL